MSERRFTEHRNVIDLVYWRRVIGIMQEFSCGAAEAIRWMNEEELHYQNERLRRMWDNARGPTPVLVPAEQYYEMFGIKPAPIVWVDEESYWKDDLDPPGYIDPYSINRRYLHDDEPSDGDER